MLLVYLLFHGPPGIVRSWSPDFFKLQSETWLGCPEVGKNSELVIEYLSIVLI